jgi:hypothetical protein
MSLTTRQLNDFKKVCEQYAQPEEIIEEELVHEICEELVEELVTEGYSEEDAVLMIEDAANDYIDEAKVTFGHDTQAKRASGAPVGARRRFAMRKAGDAVKKAGDAAKGAADRAVGTAKAAKAGAQIAGSIAKDEVKRAGRKAAHSATKAADAVKSAPGKARDKAKKGIKGFLKRQAEKVVKRMSEEVEALKASGKFSEQEIQAFMEAEVQELYKGKHGQSEKEYQDSRSDAGKMISGDSKGSGANYSYRAKNTGSNPAGGSKKPQGQARMGKKDRDYLAYRKANLKKEDIEVNEDAKYDRNRKRAAQRAADRNAARAAGKTGVVPGVGYVSPRKERETYVDSAGTTRHKSGAKMPKD